MQKNVWLIFLFCVYTFLFTLIIGGIGRFFLDSGESQYSAYVDNVSPEENTEISENASYSEVTDVDSQRVKQALLKYLKQEYEQKKDVKRGPTLTYRFFPKEYQNSLAQVYIPLLEFVFQDSLFSSYIQDLSFYFFSEKGETRGKMKSEIIYLYQTDSLSDEEFLALCFHEFGHYLDIYFLNPTLGKDASIDFYNISWKSATYMLSGQGKQDFVSGYAMTNKYEDFAESFTYFVFHNQDFLKKSEKSQKLKEKYDFFAQHFDFSASLVSQDFSVDQKYAEYIWDTTKLHYNLKKFLQYLQHEI